MLTGAKMSVGPRSSPHVSRRTASAICWCRDPCNRTGNGALLCHRPHYLPCRLMGPLNCWCCALHGFDASSGEGTASPGAAFFTQVLPCRPLPGLLVPSAGINVRKSFKFDWMGATRCAHEHIHTYNSWSVSVISIQADYKKKLRTKEI